jgi:hypothetical protein
MLTKLLATAAIASGLSIGAVELPRIAQLPAASSIAEPTSQPATSFSDPQRLSLKLTLSSPEDLKVREGDWVKQGQPLSDRVRDRQRLEARKRQLQIRMERLKQPVAGAAPVRAVPEVAALPMPSFLSQVAEVDRRRLGVAAAQRNLEQQQRKLDLLQSLPRAEVPEATVPHETELLKQRQQEVDQANAELEVSQGQLAQAQQDRQYQEYQHSLELSKRAIALQQAELQRQDQLQQQQAQERDRSFQIAQLEAQMQTLDSQLVSLSAVRSPYAGVIQRMRYEGQTDQSLTVELVLVVGNAATPSPGASSTPAASPDANRNR